jgi:acyl-CoA synthetase (NDP forming)/GNAT superfamily N-acetyltransferase
MKASQTSSISEMPTPQVPEGDAVLIDGSTIHLRALVAADREALVSFVDALTPESRRRRFFSTLTKLDGPLLESLINVDQKDAIAVVAERAGAIVAVGRAHRIDPPAAAPATETPGDSLESSAEIAFVVLDSLQGLGIATLLLESLASQARGVGIRRFVATTRVDNTEMLAVFKAAGFVTTVKRDPEDVALLTVSFSTVDDNDSVAARYHREQMATVASLRPLLRPNSIAIIGASRNPNAVGGRVLRELMVRGFAGQIVPINPHADFLESIPVFRSIVDVGVHIDLAIIAVPAEHVVEIVNQCAQAGVRSVLVLSAGFAEIGPEGRARQQQLLEATRRGGMRLIGPNCLGIVTTDPLVSMHAVFTALPMLEGSVAMMSQSGAVAIAIASMASEMGIGMSSLVSVGNKADVSGNDLLEYWDQDPLTKAIALYLESFGNPRKFGRIAREVSRTKPIVAIKAARSTDGSRAALSHTGALAVEDATVDALFEQAGVLRVDEPSELLALANAFVQLPLPKGRRIAIVGNAGGLAILAADALSHERLMLATLDDSTVSTIKQTAPDNAALHNPIDLTALATPQQLHQAISSVLVDPGVDAIVVVLVNMDAQEVANFRSTLNELVQSAAKPIVSVFAANPANPSRQTAGSSSQTGVATVPVPTAVSTREAAVVIRRMADRAEWLANLEDPELPLSETAIDQIRTIVAGEMMLRPEGAWLETVLASRIVDIVGVPVNKIVLAMDEDGAIDAAQSMGYPVCLKAANPNLVHRSDVGAVHLGLRDDFNVAAAFRSIEHAVRSEMNGALVQAMSLPGVEMIIGIQNNPAFGPIVLVGAGGRTAELWRDTALHLAPLSRSDARNMLKTLRCFPLLTGFRGGPLGDVEALVDTIVRIAQLGAEVPEIVELDINPVIVHTTGLSAVDIKIRLQANGHSGRNELRLLRG